MPKKRGIKIKKIKQVKSVPGTRRSSVGKQLPDPPPRPGAVEEKVSLANDIYNQIGAHQGDERVAKRVAQLKMEYPRGTIPELVTYDWLERENYQFWYQKRLFGGRARGGLLPDFIVHTGATGVALLVQGSYYHGAEFQRMAGQQGRDVQAEMRLLGQVVDGVRIVSVVPLREEDIYNKRPSVFRRALAGQSF